MDSEQKAKEILEGADPLQVLEQFDNTFTQEELNTIKGEAPLRFSLYHTKNPTDREWLMFQTRESGSVADESPGQEDIEVGAEFLMDVIQKTDDILGYIEIVDEWVHAVFSKKGEFANFTKVEIDEDGTVRKGSRYL